MITAENLSFTYRKSKKKLLENFSFSLERGKVYGLLGKNGVGKSTLLYLMSGLLTPQSGKVTYYGTDVRKRLPITLGEIFLVPEEFELPPVRLADYIKLNAKFYPRFSQKEMTTYLHYFEMDSDIHLNALSMGQKKKVYMSFALAANTTLILMDEPTNGLDIPGKSQFRKFIATGMTEDKTMVMSTHQVRDIDKIMDHVLIMDNSRMLLNKSITEITQKLLFLESDKQDLIEKAIFSSPSLQSHYLILPNESTEESEINLEVLFCAVSDVPERIAQIFNVSSSK
jgi:ABC-2 type transport system ATP-binding protein